MELDNNIKAKIDEYFKNHSDKECIEILNKLGIELPKKKYLMKIYLLKMH